MKKHLVLITNVCKLFQRMFNFCEIVTFIIKFIRINIPKIISKRQFDFTKIIFEIFL